MIVNKKERNIILNFVTEWGKGLYDTHLDDLLNTAKQRFKDARDFWADNFQNSEDDLHFLSGKAGAMFWRSEYNKRRNHQPPLPVSESDPVSQYINQVVNDFRQSTPAVTVSPDDGGDVKNAEVRKQIIQKIQYDSDADSAYDFALECAVKCGIGFVRIDRELEKNGGDQKLVIKRVINPLACYLDPDSTAIDGRDARYGFFVESMTKAAFQSRFGEETAISFFDETHTNDKFLNVAEYFYLTNENGVSMLNHCILAGDRILEEADPYPCDYIPLIPFYGRELWIDGVRHLSSLIRKAKEPVKKINLIDSLMLDIMLKIRGAVGLAAVGSIEDTADDYRNQTTMFARYQAYDKEGRQLPMPTSMPFPNVPQGFIDIKLQAMEDIKSSMGMYNASIGQRSNETSGVAINARKVEGEVATFHFSDNAIKSITQVGRFLISAMKTFYSRPRVLQVHAADGEIKSIGINGAMVEGQEHPYDLTQGEYSVIVTAGASYTTQREEAAAAYDNLISKNPALLFQIGDLWAEQSSFAGAAKLAARLKKMVDPKLLGEEGKNPEIAQMQQELEQAQGIIQELQMNLQDKTDAEQAKADLEIQKMQLDSQKMTIDAQIKLKELDIKNRELDLKMLEIQMRQSELEAQANAALLYQDTEIDPDFENDQENLGYEPQPEIGENYYG